MSDSEDSPPATSLLPSNSTTPAPAAPEADPSLYPSWVKVTEIPHPALVPSFISRREGLADGSIDPSSSSMAVQLGLLNASTLSPSLAQIVTNIPATLMTESIHKRNLQNTKADEAEILRFRETQMFNLPPSHYRRTMDPQTSNSSSANMANQTASELAALNILYGGVKGKVYLDSLKQFLVTGGFEADSPVARIIHDKIESFESLLGQRILNLQPEAQKPPVNLDAVAELLASPPLAKGASDEMITENHQIISWLNQFSGLTAELREALLLRLRANLVLLVATIAPEQRAEYFAGIDWNLIK